MQLKKHNSKTPPERKPKWLRKGIALLAAVATLATGGIVASTAYAGGGGGSQPGGGSGGPDGAPKVFWQYKDDASGSFGPASDINSVKKAFEAARVTLHEDSGGMTPMTKAQAALDGAKNECVEGFHRRHPGEGDGDCRVVAVGAMYSNSGYWGEAFDNNNYAELGNKNQWQYVWDKYIKPTRFIYAGSRDYYVTTPFNDDPNNSVQKIMWDKTFDGKCKVNPAWGSDVCNLGGAAVNKSIVVIVLDKYQPAPPSFTPTISTEAPHIIQEGQPITDRVTVGVKSGDHWIDGTSVTAKGYYFTGSKDAIIRNLPYTGDPTDAGINNYLNQIRSAGGEYPWVAGMGVRCGLNRAALRPVGARPGVKGGPPEAASRHFTPSLIAGRTWACMRVGRLCSLFPFRGPGGSSSFPFSVASRSGSAVSGLLCLGGLSCRQAGSPCPLLRSRSFFHTRRGWLRGCPSAVPAGSEYPSAGFASPCF